MKVDHHQVTGVLLGLGMVYMLLWTSWFATSQPFRRVVLHRRAPTLMNNSYVIEVTSRELENIPVKPSPVSTEPPPIKVPVKLKRILYWTPFNDHKDFMMGFGRSIFIHARCEINTCETTNNRSLLNSSDAVVFHLNSIKSKRSLPSTRPPNQVWIVVNGESPHSSNPIKLDGVFNLTMTYHRDSDIQFPRGKAMQMTSSETYAYNKVYSSRNPASSRTKLAAWVSNHCRTPSRRELFVKELQRHMSIDVFGSCGPNKCEHGDYECDKQLAVDYKFYLSLERSLCRDYITESLWRPLTLGTVPVVMGAGAYKEVLPPHSYIDINDFESVKALAEYLKKLDKDDALYNEYFNWRFHWKTQAMRLPESFCHLCEYLHKNEGTHKPAVNYTSQHSIQSECITPQEYFKHMGRLNWLT